MNPKSFLVLELENDDLPEMVRTESALGAIKAAIEAATEKASEFDEERLAPLLAALKKIQAASTDPVAIRVASNALQQYEDFL